TDTDALVASPVTVRATSDNDATGDAVIVALGVFTSADGKANATITGDADTEALVTTTSSLEVFGGDVVVEAISDNNATANAGGGGGAGFSVTALRPKAILDGATTATFNGD